MIANSHHRSGEEMNHETAIASEAVERYLLNELSADERDAFEEHYFDCEQCASAVRTGTALKINGQAVAKEAQRPSRPGQVTEIRPRPGTPARHFWIPAIPAAAAAMLAVVAGYQSQVTIPRLTAMAMSPRAVESGYVVHGQSRGEIPVLKLAPNALTVLTLELTASPLQSAYRVSVISNGKPAGEIANAPVKDGALQIAIPFALGPGNYEMLVRGPDGSDAGTFAVKLEK